MKPNQNEELEVVMLHGIPVYLPKCGISFGPAENVGYELEEGVIGGLFIDGDLLPAVCAVMETSDMRSRALRLVMTAIIDVHAHQLPISVCSVGAQLERYHQLEAVGGLWALARLATWVPSASKTVMFATRLHNLAKRAA